MSKETESVRVPVVNSNLTLLTCFLQEFFFLLTLFFDYFVDNFFPKYHVLKIRKLHKQNLQPLAL